MPFYDGTSFAANQNVVVVSANCASSVLFAGCLRHPFTRRVLLTDRLGVFGYAASEMLRQHNQPSNSTGNYGLEDQRFAMQWIHDNIHV